MMQSRCPKYMFHTFILVTIRLRPRKYSWDISFSVSKLDQTMMEALVCVCVDKVNRQLTFKVWLKK